MYDFFMVIKQNGKIPKSPPELRVGVTDSIKVGGVRACVCIMLFVHCPRLLPPDIFGSKPWWKKVAGAVAGARNRLAVLE